MKRAPFRDKPQQPKYYLKDIFGDRLSLLGISDVIAFDQWASTPIEKGIFIWRRMPRSSYRKKAIVIVSPHIRDRISKLSGSARRVFFSDMVLKRTTLLVFAKTEMLPEGLADILYRYELPTVLTDLDENLLESRIKAIVREKIHKTVVVHGVAIEVQGKGVLIAGPSGIGKTTTILKAVSEGGRWIADDRVVVKKEKSGDLTISGHPKIRNYFYTEKTGIARIDGVLNASQIRNKTKLSVVLEVERVGGGGVERMADMELVGVAVPRFKINMMETGYLNHNLLYETLRFVNRPSKRFGR